MCRIEGTNRCQWPKPNQELISPHLTHECSQAGTKLWQREAGGRKVAREITGRELADAVSSVVLVEMGALSRNPKIT